ncbi:transposon Tn10 TetD protein [Oxobacter pfennigii]|uniref:Transposon Tn10 TetD protein n=1 Tax=Oxobacter pfennigii TaxID=36849 RepID=A0A0P8W3Y2_9CLOT|nr:AraC family transcriptional regulator [Oxobacter pfennigii]KPU43293.1 transposon Tn10 TetD protein [Oxobacter pfennigii]
MEWLNKMMDAIDYIEMNMERTIGIEDIAKAACSSHFHFQRMFHMLTGFTVAEYIRNRKLTLAAQELAISSNIRVIDVALKYGYDSPESFAKAFRRAHGIAPSAAREPGAKLKAFPRISFHISLKGDKDMDYKIIEKEAFKVIGKSIRVSTKDGENLKSIPEFWSECNADGTSDKLYAISDKKIMFGICMDFEENMEQFSYMVAVEHTDNPGSASFEIREIPAASWAIFTSTGPMPGAIQDVWARIFQEWFPATGFEHANGPELEVYLPGDAAAKDYKCEVWIPVVKK